MHKFLLLALLTFGQTLYAQISIDSLLFYRQLEVKEIDNQILYKPCSDSCISFKPDQQIEDEWVSEIYFDKDTIVRKIITQFQYPEEEGFYIRYFNKEGLAIHSQHASYGAMNGRYSVFRYLKDDQSLLYIDFLLRDDDRNQALVEHIIRDGTFFNMPMPKAYSGSSFANTGSSYDEITHLDSLATSYIHLDLREVIYEDTDLTPTKFLPVQQGQKTYINTNSVALKRKAKSNSESIRILHFGDPVEVLKVGKVWCKIKYVYERDSSIGYVTRESLAPIERILYITISTIDNSLD